MDEDTSELLNELRIKARLYEKVLGYYYEKPTEINVWPALLNRAANKIQEDAKTIDFLEGVILKLELKLEEMIANNNK